MRGGDGFWSAREVRVNRSWLIFRCDGGRYVENGWCGIVDAWLQEGTKGRLFCTCREHAYYVRHPPVLRCGCGSSRLSRVFEKRMGDSAVVRSSFMAIETCRCSIKLADRGLTRVENGDRCLCEPSARVAKGGDDGIRVGFG